MATSKLTCTYLWNVVPLVWGSLACPNMYIAHENQDSHILATAQ